MVRPLTFAEAYAQADAVGVDMIKYAGSSNAYGSVFRCRVCKHEWSTKHNNVVSSNRTGCPACYRRTLPMSEAEMAKALEAEGMTLVGILSRIKGARTKVRVACASGHVRDVSLGAVTHAKRGCPECGRAERGVDEVGVKAKLANLGYSLVSWEGKVNANAVIGCGCGVTWETRLSSVLRGDSHCPGCFEKGFDGSKPAHFYTYRLTKNKRTLIGYGISGQFDRRDREHRRNAKAAGWKIEIQGAWLFERGHDAYCLERELKGCFEPPKRAPKGFLTESVSEAQIENFIATLKKSDIFMTSRFDSDTVERSKLRA